MERLGGDDDEPLSSETKKELNDIHARYEARIAETRILFESRLKGLDDPAEIEKVREELAAEIARLESKRESSKDRVRRGD